MRLLRVNDVHDCRVRRIAAMPDINCLETLTNARLERTVKIAAPPSESRNNTLFGRGALRVQTMNGSSSTGKG
jgi:hypothetical protein